MLLLSHFFNFSSVTLLLLLGGLLLRDAWDVRTARYGALLSISAAALMSPASSISILLEMVLFPLSANVIIFIWLFSLSLFDDDFQPGPMEWGIALLWFALGLVNFSDTVSQQPLTNMWAFHGRTIMTFVLATHIIYRALEGRQSDLVEQRRRMRSGFALAIVALILFNQLGESIFGHHDQNWPQIINIIMEIGVFLVSIWAVFWLVRMDKHVLMFDRPTIIKASSTPQLTAKESILYDKLKTMMEHEKAYLETDLSIGMLAAKLNTPEHQVRTLINKSMGYRNFRAFLNHYRMQAVKEALADPDKANLPILTLAMDCGFASLAPFNRAFKEKTGQTPSAYREAALGKSVQQEEAPSEFK